LLNYLNVFYSCNFTVVYNDENARPVLIYNNVDR